MTDDANTGQTQSEKEAADFSCEYTENIPAILAKLNISIAFTSYQAGRLMILRSKGDSLNVTFKRFPRPMGLTVNESGITLGIYTQIINFQREDGLLEQIKQPLVPIEEDITAPRIRLENRKHDNPSDVSGEEKDTNKAMEAYKAEQMEPVDDRVDACFIARSSHYSGMINIHDIDWGDDGLWVVNSSFSCLCTLDPDYSFVPRWKPHFISELVPEDRCHLNGMTLKDGKPGYVTTFSKHDEIAKWRDGDKWDGTLMDVETNTILLDGLAMPHSPRWYQGSVYFCNSGHGEFCKYDPATKEKSVVAVLPGFTRGVDFYGNIAIVGLSRIRKGNVASPTPIAELYDETYSGIWLINLETGQEIGHIKFTGNIDQIYDAAVIHGCSFPELIEPEHERMRNHFCHPVLQELD